MFLQHRLIYFSHAHTIATLLLPNLLPPIQMSQASLSTMQRNALSQFFGRKEFTPEEVAKLDYCVVSHLPKVGRKGIDTIRTWLQQYGHDLKNLPDHDNSTADRRLHMRLQNAAKLLQKHGYRVNPP